MSSHDEEREVSGVPSSFIRTPVLSDQGSPLTTLVNFNQLFKSPIFSLVTWQSWGAVGAPEYELVFRDTQFSGKQLQINTIIRDLRIFFQHNRYKMMLLFCFVFLLWYEKIDHFSFL